MLLLFFGFWVAFINRSAFVRSFTKRVFFDKQNLERKILDEELEFLKDNASENLDSICLAKEFNSLKIMNMAHFEEHHKILLPYVLAAIKQEEINKKTDELA